MNLKKAFNLTALFGFSMYPVTFLVMFYYLNKLVTLADSQPMLAIAYETGNISELIPIQYLPLLFINPLSMGGMCYWCLSDYMKIRKGESNETKDKGHGIE